MIGLGGVLLQARTWLPRARADVRIAFKARDGATALATLHQAGSGRARFPNPSEGGASSQAQAILLNMAGGLTGGDTYRVSLDLGARTDATVTTAAAEKVYRSLDGDPATVTLDAQVAEGARLLWLPQPTILFDRSVFERRTEIALSADATLVAAECLIFGRAAMGEDVTRGHVRDHWRVRRAGRLLYADTLRLEGEIAADLNRAGLFAGARAMASLVYVAQEAATRLDEVRALLAGGAAGHSIGASAWGEILLLRGLAKDGRTLQMALRPVIEALGGRQLPRIWQC